MILRVEWRARRLQQRELGGRRCVDVWGRVHCLYRHGLDAGRVLFLAHFRCSVVDGCRTRSRPEWVYLHATFGSPAYSTFYNAVRRGWLSNYPNLTPEMVRRNKPNVPAYALGHIQASRSGVRSTRHALDTSTTSTEPKATESHRQTPPISEETISEYLAAYNELEHPSINLLADRKSVV